MATIYHTAASLDGFIADPDNRLDWLMQFGDEPAGDFATFLAAVGALAMGSTTYEWVLANHVNASGGPNPWPYTQPSWVFTSRALPRVPGADIRFVQGDVRAVHETMRAAASGRDLWIVGGGDLAGQFHDAGLLDEIVVTVTSVTLGDGAPLLPRRIASPPLRLRSVKQHGAGFAELTYEVARPGQEGGAAT
jgi:dihydrofolate reductase